MDENINEKNQHRPYWKRIHHSLIFWIFLLLMMVAIIYYIMTVGFAFAPHQKTNPAAQKHSTI